MIDTLGAEKTRGDKETVVVGRLSAIGGREWKDWVREWVGKEREWVGSVGEWEGRVRE